MKGEGRLFGANWRIETHAKTGEWQNLERRPQRRKMPIEDHGRQIENEKEKKERENERKKKRKNERKKEKKKKRKKEKKKKKKEKKEKQEKRKNKIRDLFKVKLYAIRLES